MQLLCVAILQSSEFLAPYFIHFDLNQDLEVTGLSETPEISRIAKVMLNFFALTGTCN